MLEKLYSGIVASIRSNSTKDVVFEYLEETLHFSFPFFWGGGVPPIDGGYWKAGAFSNWNLRLMGTWALVCSNSFDMMKICENRSIVAPGVNEPNSVCL